VEWKDVDGDGLQDCFTARFHVGTLGGTTSQLVWLKNPGGLGVDGEGWTDWEQFVLVEGGPDVFIKFEKLADPDGIVYDVLVAGELWSERVVIYFVEDVPGAWADPANIRSNVVDDTQGVPFEASFVDLNLDGRKERASARDNSFNFYFSVGTLEIVASAINQSIPSGGAFLLYQQPADFRTDPWEKSVIASGFTPNFDGNSMAPGKHKFFYPSV
jgi:hypothetical protein